MNFTIIISTIDERIMGVKKIIDNISSIKDVTIIVGHQLTSKEVESSVADTVAHIRSLPNVIYSKLHGKGVAKNRNNALRFIPRGALCLILDDDVVPQPDIVERVQRAFARLPDAEFLSFKLSDEEGRDYKRYPTVKEPIMHTGKTLRGIGTTEMAFRSEAIAGRFRFDERFGPGAERYKTGEDYIFAMDLLRGGVQMWFVPEVIAAHPGRSTGRRFDKEILFGKGAVFGRVFGWRGLLADTYFALKHRRHCSDAGVGLLICLKSLLSGSLDFLKRVQK